MLPVRKAKAGIEAPTTIEAKVPTIIRKKSKESANLKREQNDTLITVYSYSHMFSAFC
jgi:hypothetical protein